MHDSTMPQTAPQHAFLRLALSSLLSDFFGLLSMWKLGVTAFWGLLYLPRLGTC